MCSIVGCNLPTKAYGWCRKHYSRWRRHGDPLKVAFNRSIKGDIESRFWDKVAVDDSGCWLWQASKFVDGYGRFRADGETRHAHRWAYERFVGPVPEGLQIDHLCRTRHCVRPSHMEPVTPAENFHRGAGRGASLCEPGQYLLKTCRNGHDMSGDNIVFDGGRRCRSCRNAWYRERYRKRKAASLW